MYLDSLVKIPVAPGRITYRPKASATYVEYLIENVYDPKVKYSRPTRKAIGKLSKSDPGMMQPNENYRKYFPDVVLPDEKFDFKRSSCLKVGAYIVLRKLYKDSGLAEILGQYFSEKDLGLFMDLAAYSIISENNAAQYYPDYAYNHPLFTQGMKIYSDSKISDFLQKITDDQSVGFLNSWNESRDHREKIYISYDSTNKNSEAGDIEIIEYGKPKVDVGLPIFNYSIAYDTENKVPLFYEEYPGSINDVSQLEFMLGKAHGFGYRKIGFILDRGYFSRKNLEMMDSYGYSFVIMVKGMASLVNSLVAEKKGSFESKRACSIPEYRVYGTTVKQKMYPTDQKERYFHIYHSIAKEAAEREQIETRLEKMSNFLKQHRNEVRDFGPGFQQYYDLTYDEKSGAFVYYEEKFREVEKELDLCGYFVIITSEKMTAKEAINLYKSRDASEKLFRGDKAYLCNKSLRVHSNEAMSSKIFIEFVALILRCKFYNLLKDESQELESKPNFMTVPAALKELDKIEMVRQLDGRYRLDHAVTKTQKTILKAFDLNEQNIKYRAEWISEQLATNS